METIEHFATISLVARLLGRENLIAREEVLRLQELRGTYGIKAPAPICADPTERRRRRRRRRSGDLSGRAGAGRRRPPARARFARFLAARSERDGDDAEIRLTYRELSALIEDAIEA